MFSGGAYQSQLVDDFATTFTKKWVGFLAGIQAVLKMLITHQVEIQQTQD
jgi:hypothetical protein